MSSGEVELDAQVAAVVAAAMREVAAADGDVHPQEVALIRAFGEGLPDANPRAPLDDADHLDVYLKSICLLALADGRVSDGELAVIEDLGRAQGASRELVARHLDEARRAYLATFRGVRIFREDAVQIGRDLGLSDDAIVEVLG